MSAREPSKHPMHPMRAIVKDISSTDIDLDTFVPDDPAVVGAWLTLLVGPLSAPNGDLFEVCVCTPGYLIQRTAENEPISGRFHLVFAQWNTEKILTALINLVESTTGDSWAAIGRELSKSFKWEFDDNL